MKLNTASSVGSSPGIRPEEYVLVWLGDMQRFTFNSATVSGHKLNKHFTVRPERGANPAVKGAPLRSAGLRLLRSLRPLPLR